MFAKFKGNMYGIPIDKFEMLYNKLLEYDIVCTTAGTDHNPWFVLEDGQAYDDRIACICGNIPRKLTAKDHLHYRISLYRGNDRVVMYFSHPREIHANSGLIAYPDIAFCESFSSIELCVYRLVIAIMSICRGTRALIDGDIYLWAEQNGLASGVEHSYVENAFGFQKHTAASFCKMFGDDGLMEIVDQFCKREGACDV